MQNRDFQEIFEKPLLKSHFRWLTLEGRNTIPRYLQTVTELIVQNGEIEKVSRTGYIFRLPNGSPLEGYHRRSGYYRQPEHKDRHGFVYHAEIETGG